MKPQQVNPENFKVLYMLYETFDFAIAYGEWESGYNCIAMRWNGVDEKDIGFPSMIGHPLWFILPEELTFTQAKSLFDLQNCNKLNTLLVLSESLNFYTDYVTHPNTVTPSNTQNTEYLVEIYKFSDLIAGHPISEGRFMTLQEAMKYISWVPCTWTEITDIKTSVVVYNDKVKMSEIYHYHKTREATKNKDII